MGRIHVVGLHCAKDEPQFQTEAHHYCAQVNGDLLQCVIFDGNTADANLIGVEYIISERLFNELPEEEKPFWHPHNYEILSGELVAPGLPDIAEKALMSTLINSYGKTWHFWNTGRQFNRMGQQLPFGAPRLMWSFARDGEADKVMLTERNMRMQIDQEQKRRDRQSLVKDAHPQHGVDTLKGQFPNAAADPPPGVHDSHAADHEQQRG